MNHSPTSTPEPNYFSPVDFWDSDQLLGYGFGRYKADGQTFWEIGMVFQSPDYGLRAFKAISGWNHGAETDPENEIGVSFIIMEDDSYLAYTYPTLGNGTFAEGKPKSQDAEDLKFVGIICKPFDNYKKSQLKAFVDAYKGETFKLLAYYPKGNTIEPIPGLRGVLKRNLKVKSRSQLTPADVEWHHIKNVVEG
jgi:hypothetical protein